MDSTPTIKRAINSSNIVWRAYVAIWEDIQMVAKEKRDWLNLF